jgi:TonB family protein
MQIKKDEIKGIVGTIIFHALLLVAIMFAALRTPLPLPDEGGVEVNLGNSEEGTGTVQPEELSQAASTSPPPRITRAPDEVVTDNNDEAPAIQPKKEEKPVEAERKEPTRVVRQEPVAPPQPKVNPRALFPGKASTGGTGGSEGITGKTGDQGNPTGSPGAQSYEGSGGSGSGVSFSLSGRSSRQIPRPSNNFSNEGIVVVTIYVNRAGSVTRVISGAQGTTTSNLQLRQLAEQAARQAKFSPKEDAPEEQKGTITYIFELN